MDHEPLTEATFYILTTLIPAAKHGYAIMQEVTELSGGRVNLSTGTLYTALKRLLDSGWIEDVTPENTPRGRKDYRLTPTGRVVLQSEMERLTELSALARRRLGDSPA